MFSPVSLYLRNPSAPYPPGGSMDKVFVRDGKLVDTNCGDMSALCIIGGKAYHVRGTVLTE